MTPKRWIESTNAIGIVSKSGRYGGTFAHKDIALEFASWISIEFKLYVINELQRLKDDENNRLKLEWNLQRTISKINYQIHTNAIKGNLIPKEITKQQASFVYANEADLLNVALLAVAGGGLKRNDLIKKAALPSGGSLTHTLDELIQSGFISAELPFNHSQKDIIYKLTDEYTRFYLNFINNNNRVKEGSWLSQLNSHAWKSWSGVAFEAICLKHIPEIKKALGISGIFTEEAPWRYTPKSQEEQGVQIDLLIDRKDQTINICEMKFYSGKFTIEKKYAEALRRKIDLFRKHTKTQKSIFLVAITTFGVADGMYKTSLIQNEITMDALFE